MAGMNGVQLARLWARAWRDPKTGLPDPTFKTLLEQNPRQAAKDFREECIQNQYADFPDPGPDLIPNPILNLEEYEHVVVNFKHIPPEIFIKLMRKLEKMPWVKSKFVVPKEVIQKLLKGDFEIY